MDLIYFIQLFQLVEHLPTRSGYHPMNFTFYYNNQLFYKKGVLGFWGFGVLGLPAERLLLVCPEFEFPLLDRGGHERTLVPILGLCRLQGVLLLLLQGLECW